ncbi:MAG: hypothetical protein WCB63_14830, partial [Polyangiales bacterium]
MRISRWTLGIGLAASVSVWGLVEAGASPFSMYFVADDISNRVSGTVPDASDWDSGGGDSGGGDSGGGDPGG